VGRINQHKLRTRIQKLDPLVLGQKRVVQVVRYVIGRHNAGELDQQVTDEFLGILGEKIRAAVRAEGGITLDYYGQPEKAPDDTGTD